MKSNHNNHLIPFGEKLRMKGVMLRKWDYNEKGKYLNPNRKNLDKQIKTLHTKLKKNDKVFTEYTIERDRYENKYHVHMIIQYYNEDNLSKSLSNYIGGNEWKKREVGLDSFNECNGKYGLIHTEDIIDEHKYRGYLNKVNQSKNLI